MSDIDSILRFADLLQQFRAVERVVLVKNKDRYENDGEHSYSLAMLAWYINETYKLGLDQGKLFAYALAHDLVETYAGDTYLYDEDKTLHESKKQREEDAAQRLRAEFSEFFNLHEIIDTYENRTNKESIFIYALDKVEPILSIYLDKGRTWKKHSISLDMLKTMKLTKVALDPMIAKIFDDLVKKLESEKGLFTTLHS